MMSTDIAPRDKSSRMDRASVTMVIHSQSIMFILETMVSIVVSMDTAGTHTCTGYKSRV